MKLPFGINECKRGKSGFGFPLLLYYGGKKRILYLKGDVFMSENKFRWKPFLVCLAIPILGGTLAGLISMGGMDIFASVNKPPLSPPAWLFPVVWTILYALMGIASYLVYNSGSGREEKRRALTVYGVQLLFNFIWPILFFNFGMYYFAFFWLVALWALIIYTMVLFGRITKPAAYLLIPYLLWVTFAGYLNLGIAVLN